jgi:cleavage and polyadenylation specificity factor subunit 2
MSSVRFTPLYGVHSEADPLCFVLEVDECILLLDCGWTEDFDENFVKALEPWISRINYVLISHADMEHIGGLPYLFAKLGADVPVYATLPVHYMGQMMFYDLLLGKSGQNDLPLTLDDVDSTFDHIRKLEYYQTVALEGVGTDISITPFAAGNSLGACIWRISKETDIIYAVDYNPGKERHLNPCAIAAMPQFHRPHLLITDAYNAELVNVKQWRKTRDEQLVRAMIDSLRKNGNVLVGSDASSRVFELLVLLEDHWAALKLNHYPIFFLTHVSKNTVEFAQSMLVWMSEEILSKFDAKKENPLGFKYIRTVHSLEEVYAHPGPKVVITSSDSLDCGYSRELFVEWGEDDRNLLVLTRRGGSNSLGRFLRTRWNRQFPSLSLIMHRHVELEGEELEAYRQKKKEEEGKKKAKAREAAMGVTAAGEAESSDDESMRSDSDSEMGEQLPQNVMERLKVFPFNHRVKAWDEYGEIIKPERYLAMSQHVEGDLESMMELVPAAAHGSAGGGDHLSGGVDMDREPQNRVTTLPSKVVQDTVNLRIRCRIEYFDFEGRPDYKFYCMMLKHVAPRKLIVVGGSTSATQKLVTYAKSQESVESVFAPQSGDSIDVTSDVNVFKVVLQEGLLNKVYFQKRGEHEVAYLQGRVVMDEVRKLPILEIRPELQHAPVHFGTVNFGEFRQKLAAANILSELRTSATGSTELVCFPDSPAPIRIQKDENEQLHIHGKLSRDYFLVRKTLYDQFTMV